MSWNSQAAQIATAKPATAMRLSTVTPAIATHLSRGRSNGLTASRGAPPLQARSNRLRMRRQRARSRRAFGSRGHKRTQPEKDPPLPLIPANAGPGCIVLPRLVLARRNTSAPQRKSPGPRFRGDERLKRNRGRPKPPPARQAQADGIAAPSGHGPCKAGRAGHRERDAATHLDRPSPVRTPTTMMAYSFGNSRAPCHGLGLWISMPPPKAVRRGA